MSEALWTEVDDYLNETLVRPDDALNAAVADSAKAGLPQIQVAPNQGKLLMLLAQIRGARRILEIGTLGGYSTTWLARALPPGGRLVTLELEPKHARVAQANLDRAGVADRVEIRVGPAAGTLKKMIAAREQPFDLVFIDADKTGYPDYLTLSLELSHPGTLIVADNVVRKGAIADRKSEDKNVQAIRRMNAMIASNPRLNATVIQTVGSKGYDGLAFALVGERPSRPQ